jgi:hypothetical protein
MKKTISLLTFALVLAAAAPQAFAGFGFPDNYKWEGGSVSSNQVEAVSGGNFAAYTAFRDWAQTQSVSSGAGLSVGLMNQQVGGSNIYLGNFTGANVNVTAGSYIAVSMYVGSDYTVNMNSDYVSDYHVNYYEVNTDNHYGYVVAYFKLKAFTLNYDSDPGDENVGQTQISIGDFGSGENYATTILSISHGDVIGEPDPGENNMIVSSGLLDSTPEIPPQAIPAVYSGLATALFYTRNRFRRKKK